MPWMGEALSEMQQEECHKYEYVTNKNLRKQSRKQVYNLEEEHVSEGESSYEWCNSIYSISNPTTEKSVKCKMLVHQ